MYIIPLLFIIVILIFIWILSKSKINNLVNQNEKLNYGLDELNKDHKRLLIYEGKYEQLKNENFILRQEKENIENQINNIKEKLFHTESEKMVNERELTLIKQERDGWEKEKEKLLYQIAEEIIKRNNQQQAEFGKNQQIIIQKVTEDLIKNFENVNSKIFSLTDDVKKTAEDSNLIKNALLNPVKSGKLSEITLENILKNSGLREKFSFNDLGDYIIQSHFNSSFSHEGSSAKRPDAILFLPNNQVTIIDSKSSIYFLDLERAKDVEGEYSKIQEKIKESFKRHVDNLSKKDYKKFLTDELEKFNYKNCNIFTIMFLQTEQMLDMLNQIDPNIERKAFENNIIIATPIGLIHYLNQASKIIERVKQIQNIDEIKVEIKKLLENLAVIFKDSQDIGKLLNKTLLTHNKITKTLNKKIYGRIKNITELGIESGNFTNIKLIEEIEDVEE